MNISIGTIARTACLALALTNQILSATGHAVLPIEDSQLEALITSGLTVAASLAAWWKEQQLHPGRHPGRPGPARCPAELKLPRKKPGPLDKGRGR